LETRKFVTVGEDPAYLLVAGPDSDSAVVGVLVAVSLAEAERAAELETHARANRTGRYLGAAPVRPEMIPVHVEVSAVVDPPPPDVGQVVLGAETVGLPVGSIIQPVLPPPQPDRPPHQEPPLPPPPLLRTDDGWHSTYDMAWHRDDLDEPITPASTVRFLVIYRATAS
jgi:hypothetical protein